MVFIVGCRQAVSISICNFFSGDGYSVSDPTGIQQLAIKRIVTEGLAQLYAQNLQILQLDVAERTICAQLASILQRSFANHAVHAEYNRHGVAPKEIELPDSQGVLTRNRVNAWKTGSARTIQFGSSTSLSTNSIWPSLDRAG